MRVVSWLGLVAFTPSRVLAGVPVMGAGAAAVGAGVAATGVAGQSDELSARWTAGRSRDLGQGGSVNFLC
ncbi:MAG: hypothetical protein M3Z75_21845 [Actinomycetota bacterium]|nr:hypothetical protein [Actinomycetota bacterium]